ncbi:hypothetical protein D3C85_1249350 [compost metagenome]
MANNDCDFTTSPSAAFKLAKASAIGIFLETTKGNQFQPTAKLIDQVFKFTGTPLIFNFCPVCKLTLYILVVEIPPLAEIDPDQPLNAGLLALR